MTTGEQKINENKKLITIDTTLVTIGEINSADAKYEEGWIILHFLTKEIFDEIYKLGHTHGEIYDKNFGAWSNEFGNPDEIRDEYQELLEKYNLEKSKE